jgi:hypothetical protein
MTPLWSMAVLPQYVVLYCVIEVLLLARSSIKKSYQFHKGFYLPETKFYFKSE